MDDIRDSQGSRREDSDLNPEFKTPAQGGTAGGRLAEEIGSRDEERLATEGEPEPTRATKKDKEQPFIPTRADNEGAQEV